MIVVEGYFDAIALHQAGIATHGRDVGHGARPPTRRACCAARVAARGAHLRRRRRRAARR